MDPDQDQSTDDVGTIRWVDDVTSPLGSPTSTSIQLNSSQSSTTSTTSSTVSHQQLRNKVTYYEKVWSSGKTIGDVSDGNNTAKDETDKASSAFSIDVHAFEKRLQEERERKTHEQSPRIDVKLKATPQPSPRPIDLPLSSNVRVNIRHHIESIESPSDEHCQIKRERLDSNEYHEQHHSRVLTYEKVITKKSTHKVNIKSSTTTTATSPIVRTVEYTEIYGRSPSSERVRTPIDDSAYQSERTRILRGSTTPTGAVSSKSSSNNSLHSNLLLDETFHTNRQQRTPSRERIFERAGSEPHSWSSSAYGSVATTTSPVSSVAHSNDYVRRHLARERHDSGDSDGASSSDWYQEYRSQSFHTTAPRMDFKRSNSQYDRHIQQIRGMKSFLFLGFFLFK